MSEFQSTVEGIISGRNLNPFDLQTVETVAGLIMQIEASRRVLDAEGIVLEDGMGKTVEHPAVSVEKKCSQELRGWIKDRPDLFGQQKERPGKRRFEPKIV